MIERREIRPTPKQEEFLRSPAKEVLFGGAAGPGKSFALLLGALRFVDHRYYRALLLRRTFADLESSLLERSHEIYPHLGARYLGDKHVWLFPSGARIKFGYLEHDKHLQQYDGPEYQHIGFDELTQFTKKQFTFLYKALRGPHGIPTFIRATTNPGGPGHEWVLERYAPWLYLPGNASYRGPYASPGQLLYFRHAGKGQTICAKDWYDTTCKGSQTSPACSPGAACPKHRPRSRTFIPATLSDNPFLADTGYEADLDELDPVTKAWKKDGDWHARPEAGRYFQRGNIPILPARPAQVIAWVRYWDRAATQGAGDWTVGVLMCVLDNGLFVVADVVREQLGPGGVEALIHTTAALDPPGTAIGIEQDPGSAGKFEAAVYITQLAGYNVYALPPQGDKITRAGPVSAQSAVRNLAIVRAAWNEAYILELENFPAGTKDQVDATSGAFRMLLPALVGYRNGARGGGVTVRMFGG